MAWSRKSKHQATTAVSSEPKDRFVGLLDLFGFDEGTRQRLAEHALDMAT
jgi:hypothetical protein